MALDKLVDSAQLDADLGSVADAIRAKGGTSAALAFPAGFNAAIAAISGGITPSGNVQLTKQTGTDVTQYATASVRSAVTTVSASKGTVSNHTVSVTPSFSVTTSGWIASGASGTPVSVSASELVSGSETKTANGTYDVTNLAQLVVAIPYYDGSVSG